MHPGLEELQVDGDPMVNCRRAMASCSLDTARNSKSQSALQDPVWSTVDTPCCSSTGTTELMARTLVLLTADPDPGPDPGPDPNSRAWVLLADLTLTQDLTLNLTLGPGCC